MALSPVDPVDRDPMLDALRGFAMFGVLWSNLNDWYGGIAGNPRVDTTLDWLQTWVLESRFYSILGLLFGVGFALQLVRAEAAGRDIRWPFMRRLLALLVIGIIHGTLIWSGDILVQYALLGFALLLFRDVPTRRLPLAALGLFFLVPPVRAAIMFPLLHLEPVPEAPRAAAQLAYAHGTYAEITRYRVADVLSWWGRFGFNGFSVFLPVFVMGLWLVRIGFVADWRDRIPAIRRARRVALAGIVAGALASVYLDRLWPLIRRPPLTWAEYFARTPRVLLGLIPFWLLCWSMAIVAAATLSLAMNDPQWARRLRPLAAVGRMPLTTYLTQSVVCTLIFYGYGLALTDYFTPAGKFALTIGLFAAQMGVSSWWCDRFRFGPVEWLWRTISYGRRQPMKLRPSVQLAV